MTPIPSSDATPQPPGAREATRGARPTGEQDLDPATLAAIERQATSFVDRVTAVGASATTLQACAAEIDRLGAGEVRGSAAVTESLLARDVRIVSDMARKGGPTSRALDELRLLVANLDPSGLDAGLPGDPAAWLYPGRVAAAEAGVGRAADLLANGRAALDEENAVIGQQERSLWLQMAGLRRSASLAQRIDETLAARVASFGPADAERAQRLSVDVLLPVRRRRRDLLTHLAVAAQGYAALRMIEATNHDLVVSIDRAVETARTAVRAAALAVRSATTARQLGQTFTADDVRRAMAAAMAALNGVNRSHSDVLGTIQSTMKTLQVDAERVAGD